ncbi:Hypothetical predicted protein [Octopus vulgaris]|uniref:Uncharacterized protein n=1 Tax=Octopus vulgaris TaxID=6645 RepID=A0AA36AZH3_OCTVU|nr:Hypothetical predicted protein [Octopus vulgaris]
MGATDSIEFEKGEDKVERGEQNEGDTNTLDNCEPKKNAKVHQERPKVKLEGEDSDLISSKGAITAFLWKVQL